MCLILHFCTLLVIISYRPGDDQFWIGCTMAEAEIKNIESRFDWLKNGWISSLFKNRD